MNNQWALYAIYGFLIFVALVVAPIVKHYDKKKKERQGRHSQKS
jgi:hypothetical protein